jgi:hypothetical protein
MGCGGCDDCWRQHVFSDVFSVVCDDKTAEDSSSAQAVRPTISTSEKEGRCVGSSTPAARMEEDGVKRRGDFMWLSAVGSRIGGGELPALTFEVGCTREDEDSASETAVWSIVVALLKLEDALDCSS